MFGTSAGHNQFYHQHPLPAGGPGHAPLGMKPVGVFWDIENCPLPKGKTASAVINFLRSFFIVNRLNHREYEFLIACDIMKLRKDIPDDINRAGGVTLAHVSGLSKNAADEKLRESMKRFVDTHASLSPVLVLVSGDIDFVNDLRGFQTRLGCSIIVIHGGSVSPHFKTGWNEIYPFQNFLMMMEPLPAPGLEPKKTNGEGVSAGQPKEKKAQKKGVQQSGGAGVPGRGQSSAPQSGQNTAQTQQMLSGLNKPLKKGMSNFQQSQAGAGRGNGQPLLGQKTASQSQQNPGLANREKMAANITKQPPFKSPTVILGGQPTFDSPTVISGGATLLASPPLMPHVVGKAVSTQAQAGKKKNPKGLETGAGSASPNPMVEKTLFSISQLSLDPSGPTKEVILMVTGLPGKMDFRILKEHLQNYASSVSGRVKYVHNGQGFISFARKQDAEAAVKLFQGREVYGKKLNIQLSKTIPFPNPNQAEKVGTGLADPVGGGDFVLVSADTPTATVRGDGNGNGATPAMRLAEEMEKMMRNFNAQRGIGGPKQRNKPETEEPGCIIQ